MDVKVDSEHAKAGAMGAGIALLGVRAAVRPSRPFRLETMSNSPWINTTRRLGAFYVMAGVVWALLALVAATNRKRGEAIRQVPRSLEVR